jgi:hypothetical protein
VYITWDHQTEHFIKISIMTYRLKYRQGLFRTNDCGLTPRKQYLIYSMTKNKLHFNEVINDVPFIPDQTRLV